LHEDLLPEGTAAVAGVLAQWGGLGQFYLAGGTALTLHLGHRRSRDLDFFTRIPTNRLPSLVGIGADDLLTRFARVERQLESPEQIQWRLNDVSVTLLAYPFPHHFPYQWWGPVAVADARDVAVQKAYTVGRRARARDYLDLHAVLTGGLVSLDDLLQLAQSTYHDAFSARLFLQQLTYTADLPDRDDALSLLVTPQSFETIAQELAAVVRDWAARRLGAASPPGEGPER
jgi:hypothetical protein